MKKVLLFLIPLCLFFSSANAENWQLIEQTEKHDSYIDLDSVQKSSVNTDLYKFWEKTIFKDDSQIWYSQREINFSTYKTRINLILITQNGKELRNIKGNQTFIDITPTSPLYNSSKKIQTLFEKYDSEISTHTKY